MEKNKLYKFAHGAEKGFVWFLWGVLIIYCISLLIPLLWMIYTSFKRYDEYYMNPYSLPSEWIFSNYPSVFDKLKITVTSAAGRKTYGVMSMVGYSFLWATGFSAFTVFVTTLTAYVFSRYEFFGRKFLFALGIFVMITPIVGNMPSAMVLRKTLGVYDNFVFMMITAPSTAFSGLHFLLLHAAFKRLSWSYAEAVFVDGGGHFTALFNIMFPMILPTCVVLFVLNFFSAWNDYSTFMVWMPSYPNLAFGIYTFQNSAADYGATMPEILAGFVMVMIPTAILYVCLQNLIVSKFTVGGLKG